MPTDENAELMRVYTHPPKMCENGRLDWAVWE